MVLYHILGAGFIRQMADLDLRLWAENRPAWFSQLYNIHSIGLVFIAYSNKRAISTAR
jgi:hypothetical protein